MPTYTLLTPADLEKLAEAFVAAPGGLSKPKALNTIARTIAGPRHDWGVVKNAAQNTFVSQRAKAQQAKDQRGHAQKAAQGTGPLSTLPSPHVGDPAPDPIMISRDTSFASGISDHPPSPQAALHILQGAGMDPSVAVSACKTRCLHDLLQDLPQHFAGRAFTLAPIHTDALSPNDITGRPSMLVFDTQQYLADLSRQSHGLGHMAYDVLPVLAFVETAWSETLKAIDDSLAARFLRWQIEARSCAPKEAPAAPPHAVFFVANPQAFHDVVHRHMPFVHSALTTA